MCSGIRPRFPLRTAARSSRRVRACVSARRCFATVRWTRRIDPALSLDCSRRARNSRALSGHAPLPRVRLGAHGVPVHVDHTGQDRCCIVEACAREASFPESAAEPFFLVGPSGNVLVELGHVTTDAREAQSQHGYSASVGSDDLDSLVARTRTFSACAPLVSKRPATNAAWPRLPLCVLPSPWPSP